MKIIIIQFINYTLAFLMWMIIGRVLLTLIVGNRPNIMTNAFIKITEPVYRLSKKIIPFAKEGCIPFISVGLIILIRLLIVVIFKPGLRQ